MSHEPSSDRKRKAVEESEVAIHSDDRNPKKSKASTASLDSMTLSQIASLHGTTPVATERVTTTKKRSSPSSSEEEQDQEEQEDEEEQDQEEQEDEGEQSASNTPEQEASMRRIEKMIQDLSGSDNEKVVTTLAALSMDIKKDPTTRDNIVAAGGCDALFQLLKNCLEAIDSIPACDHVTELIEFAERETLFWTLVVITDLAYRHDESKVGITAIGGVEAVVKAMKTFPKCQMLQDHACVFLCYLTCHNRATGKKRAAESGGIEVLVAAINNHLGSSIICGHACRALLNIVGGSKKNTELLISVGGEAAISKILTNWPDLDKANGLLQYPTAQMAASRPTVRNSCKSSEVVIASPKVVAFSSQLPEPKATPELVSQQPKNDHKCKSTGAPDVTNTNAYQESSAAPLSSQAVPSANVPVAVEPKSRLQQPTPVEEQGPALGVESLTEKRAEPQAEVQPSTSTKADEILLERHESVEQDLFPIDNNVQVRDDKTNDDGDDDDDDDASLAPIPCTQAPEVVAGRYDRKCKNTTAVTILEATGGGESNATRVVTRNIRSLRERKSQNARMDTTERDSTAFTSTSAHAEPEDQIQSIGTLIHHLFYSDNVAFGAALYALHVDLVKDLTRWDHFVAVSGCFAVVPIMWFVVKELACWVSEESG
jgi:hypothetical protein